MPLLKDIDTWTECLGHSRLRSFTDDEGHFWLQQNASKASQWAKLAREGHAVAWEFDSPGGSYTGRLLIDGEIYKTSEATIMGRRKAMTRNSVPESVARRVHIKLFNPGA